MNAAVREQNGNGRLMFAVSELTSVSQSDPESAMPRPDHSELPTNACSDRIRT